MSRLLKMCFLLISMNRAEITHSQNSEGKTRTLVWGVYFMGWKKLCVINEVLFSNWDHNLCSLDFMELYQQRISPRLIII